MAKSRSAETHPLKLICQSWLEKIKLAKEVREEKFGKYAREISKFYDGPHDFMWQERYAQGPGGFLDKNGAVLPTFRVTINNIFKAVALFGPVLYHKNPNVQVTVDLPLEISPEALGIDPADPFAMQQYQMLAFQEQQSYRAKQACAAVKTRYSNWLQRETDKKRHARRTITEAIVTGLGYMETSIFQPPASPVIFPRSTYLSWMDVVVDPDASYWEDVQWVSVRRCRAVNLTERRFELPPDDLEGHHQSFAAQATPKGRKEAKEHRKGQSFDLIEYWEVFSKNGFGHRLHDEPGKEKPHKFDYDVLGDYCWVVVAEDIPYPLNLHTSFLEQDLEVVQERVRWPIPFYGDIEGWPLSRLSFYDKEGEVWPISIFKPAIGEMRFVNWCMSFLADKVASQCHTYVGMLKHAGTTIQKQLNGVNTPFTVIEIAEALGIKNISEAVSFLQAPNFPSDIWTMLAQVIQEIDEKTGVTELLQGMTGKQMRSAAEAQIKNDRVSVRPDDMAASAEDFYSEVALREIQAARWRCRPEDVAPAVGQMGALVWQNHVMTADIDALVRDYNYQVEAGSARKPNKETKIAQLTELAQYAFPVAQVLIQGGIVEPYNALMADICKAMDLDPERYMVQLPQQQGPSPEEQKLQMEMQMKVQELQLEMQKMQAELAMDKERMDAELEHEEDLHELDVKEKKAGLAMKKQESQARVKATKSAAKRPGRK